MSASNPSPKGRRASDAVQVKIALIVLFILYSAIEGIREAHYYHLSPDTKSFNLHRIYAIQRLLLGSLVAYITKDWFFCLGLVLIFPFFHDGFYFKTRNKLNADIYKDGFSSNSSTSTAFFEFDFIDRFLMFEVGIVFLGLDLIFR